MTGMFEMSEPLHDSSMAVGTVTVADRGGARKNLRGVGRFRRFIIHIEEGVDLVDLYNTERGG